MRIQCSKCHRWYSSRSDKISDNSICNKCNEEDKNVFTVNKFKSKNTINKALNEKENKTGQ